MIKTTQDKNDLKGLFFTKIRLTVLNLLKICNLLHLHALSPAILQFFFSFLVHIRTALYLCLTIALYLEESCVPLPDRLLVVAGVLLQEVDILLGQLLLHTTRTHHRKK